MNFKTPFKVLTTAALIGTLSLSTVAPGAAFAEETNQTTTATDQVAQENKLDAVIIEKDGKLYSLSPADYLKLKGSNDALLEGSKLKYLVSQGKSYNPQEFLTAKASNEQSVDKAFKSLDENDQEVADVTASPVTVDAEGNAVIGEEAAPVDKTALEAAIADAEKLEIADETAKAALAEAVKAAKEEAAKEEATQADIDKAVEALEKAVEAAKASIPVVVETVTAITKTTVKVSFPALKEAVENPVFTVTDGEGKEVAVKEIKLIDADETEATLTFVTPLTEEPTGKWKVNGVEFDTDAVAAAKAVTSAKTEVALLAALQSPYFTDVNEELVTGYKAAVDALEEDATVEEIQAAIDAENKKGNETTVVEAVNEAENQVQLLKALQNGGFERVNADLIADYASYDKNTDNTADYTVAADAAAVQSIIDEVNYAAAEDLVEAADTTPATALTTAAIAKAQTAVTALPEKTDSEKAAKKVLQDRLALATAVAKVKAADSQASLLKALKEPVLALENIDDKLAKYYKAEFDKNTGKAAITSVTYDLQALILDAGKDAAIDALEDKISKTTDKTAVADLKADLTELKRLDADNFKSGGTAVEIIDALVEDYRAALVDETTATNKNTTELIAGILSTTNDPAIAINTVKTAAAGTDSAALLTALKAKTLNLKNVVDANKEAYFAEIVNKDGVKYFTKVTTTEDAQKVVTVANAYVEANKATMAADLSKKLTAFAVAADDLGGVNEAKDIINLSSASKLEVAQLFLNTKEATSAKYVTAYEFADALNKAMQAQVKFLVDVNAATNNSTMKAALNNETAFPEFTELDAATKVEVSEKVLNKLTELRAEDKAPAVSKFKTIAEVKAAAGL